MANEFFYSQPVKIWFGEGEFDRLSAHLRELGCEKCVAVCGRHMGPRLRAMAAADGLIAAVFDGVAPDPQLSGVEEVVRLARKTGADAVVGVGGGSAMDTAKYAAAVASVPGSAEDYYRGRRTLPDKGLRIVAVPTTAGTGSEVTQVSVISCGEEKITTNHPAFMPAAAVVDPLLTATVPPRTTMNTGLDALAHALEGYWSRNHQPIADLMAVEAVRLVTENLERAWRDGSDREARRNMSMAALLGGLAFAQPKTAACHACSYPLSEHFHIPHGEACAFTLDSFVRINADERLEKLCRAANVGSTEALASRIAGLKKLAGLRCRLSELGEADPAQLARECAAHPLMANNPVPMDEGALRRLFEALR